jgi:glyoxylase-like metal-dependent hydrolase (beta-lactamase superfamily II)
MRPFETEYEVAPGVLVSRTGGHTPGHNVVRLASGGDRVTFAGDAVFQVGFEHPDWYNGFEHDPEDGALSGTAQRQELRQGRDHFGGPAADAQDGRQSKRTSQGSF